MAEEEKGEKKKKGALAEWAARMTALLLGKKEADKLREEQKDKTGGSGVRE